MHKNKKSEQKKENEFDVNKIINKFKVTNNKKSPVNPFVLLLIGLVIWSFASLFSQRLGIGESVSKDIALNELVAQIKNGEVSKVTIVGNSLKAELKNGDIVKTTKEPQISFYELLDLQKVDPQLVSGGIFEEQSFPWFDVIGSIAFPLVSILLLWWIFRQAGKGAGGVFSIGKSKAKLFSKEDSKKTGFGDVAGANEIKDELFEIVDFLKKPEKYRKLGARIPKGVLLIGPSGVGKTLLARAIAGEAGVPFYSVAGSEFIEMIVGVGSARVRDLFQTAKETSPSLIFIDEIDAIGRQRGRSAAVSNDEREQTLNQILVEMDGFDQRDNVIIIAATNRPDMLDSALIRPGRFDRNIRIDLPNVEERRDIIKIHMRGKPFAAEVDIERIAKQTVGFSGADIENMLNEAAILAARKDAVDINAKDISEASTKVRLGPGRKLLQSDAEKKMTAYHEAGHALVAAKTKGADQVTKITIVPRAMSLGHTQYEPSDDYTNFTQSKVSGMIRAALGGRAAEEVVFDEFTVGASNDIERATTLAHRMVTDFGMSSLGPINYVNSNLSMFEPNPESKAIGYSEEIAKKIDAEVSKIINNEYEEARKILLENRSLLDRISEELLQKETLEQDDFDKIMSESSPE